MKRIEFIKDSEDKREGAKKIIPEGTRSFMSDSLCKKYISGGCAIEIDSNGNEVKKKKIKEDGKV